jgi:hypothetical protein
MPEEVDLAQERQERLEQVIGTYLQAVDARSAPDVDRFILEHPDVRSELAEFFAAQDRINYLVGPHRLAGFGAGKDDRSEPAATGVTPRSRFLGSRANSTQPGEATTEGAIAA